MAIRRPMKSTGVTIRDMLESHPLLLQFSARQISSTGLRRPHLCLAALAHLALHPSLSRPRYLSDNEALLHSGRTSPTQASLYRSKPSRRFVFVLILPAGICGRVFNFLHQDTGRAHTARTETERSREQLHRSCLQQGWGGTARRSVFPTLALCSS